QVHPRGTPPYLNSERMPSAAKEICAGCHRPIEDRFLLKVMENSWHEHCLQCSMCHIPLSVSCFCRDRKLYCKVDYDKIFGTKCSCCMQPIPANELVMRAIGNVYHLRCFACVACGHQLQKGDQFVIRDGQLFCRMDFEKEYGVMPLSPKSDDGESFDDVEGETAKGPKRPRTILTTSQRRKFKASFEVNPKPCRKVRESLAAETGLSVRVVQVWFQNQRAKVKKLARRQNQENSLDTKKGQQRSQKRKKDDDHDSDGGGPVNGSESNMTRLPPLPDCQQYDSAEDQLSYYEKKPLHRSSQLYTSQPPLSESQLYSDGGLDESMDNIDHVLMTDANTHNNLSSGPVINPIDKLYSMQNSYFSAD
ncbi:LIM homeobox transcription factor 1-alpha-like isoform X1, partial [Argonauta hians]